MGEKRERLREMRERYKSCFTGVDGVEGVSFRCIRESEFSKGESGDAGVFVRIRVVRGCDVPGCGGVVTGCLEHSLAFKYFDENMVSTMVSAAEDVLERFVFGCCDGCVSLLKVSGSKEVMT